MVTMNRALRGSVGDSRTNLRTVYQVPLRKTDDRRDQMVHYTETEILAYNRRPSIQVEAIRTLPGRWEGWLPGAPSDSPLRLVLFTATPEKAFVPLDLAGYDLPSLWHTTHRMVAEGVELAETYAATVPFDVLVDQGIFEATHQGSDASARWLAAARYALHLSSHALQQRLLG